MANEVVTKKIAYYYPNPMWDHGDWVKNLILFFDGVALLVPEYMKASRASLIRQPWQGSNNINYCTCFNRRLSSMRLQQLNSETPCARLSKVGG